MSKIAYCVMMGIIGMAGAVYAEAVAIYQVTDMAGQSEHQVLNKEASTNLAAQIKEEAKVFPLILATAKKEWEANKENKIPFPAAKIKLRTAKKVGSDFPSKDAAEKKMTQIEGRIADKIAQDAKEKTSGRNNNKKQKPDPEEVAKESMKTTLINNAINDINKRMAEKLGREIPMFGFISSTSEKKDEKKEVKKEAVKEAVKEVKKEVKKDAEKK
ncbi:MAG: hypothetical protein WCJ02_11480 [bacterium]